jgi:hypothetical protein
MTMMKGRRYSDCTADTEISFSSAEFLISPDDYHPRKLLSSISTIDISPIQTETERFTNELDKSSKMSKNQALDSALYPECATGSPMVKSTCLRSGSINSGCDNPSSPAHGRTIQDFLANLPEIEDILSDSDEGESEEELKVTTTLQTTVASRRKKVVSFGKVDVRSYERIMSDNPGSASGPSIGIGWAFAQEEGTTVDEWDSKDRRGTSKQRRSNLVLSPKKRANILLSRGYSGKEITEMARSINKARSQRRNTVTNLDNQGLEEFIENARLKLKNALSFPQTKIAC